MAHPITGNEILAMKEATKKMKPEVVSSCPRCGWTIEGGDKGLHCKLCGWGALTGGSVLTGENKE